MSQFQGQFCRFSDHGGNVCDNVVFVEVENPGNDWRWGPGIIDKRKPNNLKMYTLNKSQAYILRMVLQKVPIELLPDLYLAEFNVKMNKDQLAAKIDNFIDALVQRKLLKPVPKIKEQDEDFAAPSGDVDAPLAAKPFTQTLYIDFSVGTNPTGTLNYKIPPT